MDQKIILGVVGLLIAASVGIFMLSPQNSPLTGSIPPGTYAPLAQCLTDAGAVFYGAFWCPHCQAQKRLFGDAADLLPYVECSTPDGEGQLPICAEAEIKSYPTWVFADGTRLSGEVPLATLAEKTNCILPPATE